MLSSLTSQSLLPESILVIDSSSTDSTVQIAQKYGCIILNIDKENFSHGGTRNLALSQFVKINYIVYLTQDAILASPDSLKNIITIFKDPNIGAAYGRQLPRIESQFIEKFERLFNYSEKSTKKEYINRFSYGLKTTFISNSFAAYRVNALQEVGGFPSHVIMAEDMYVVAKMLMAGWSVFYCAEATVYHSHDYTLKEIFNRYFDTGVFHHREPWIQENFGNAKGEGKKYVLAEIEYLWRNKPSLIPYALIRNVAKLLGYKLGLAEAYLPVSVKRIMSMHKGFWDDINNQ